MQPFISYWNFYEKTDTSVVEGNIYELEGQLNFIDQIDKFHRPRKKRQ